MEKEFCFYKNEATSKTLLFDSIMFKFSSVLMHVLNLRVLEKGQKVEENLLLCNEVKKRVYKDTPDYLQAGYKMRKLRKKL